MCTGYPASRYSSIHLQLCLFTSSAPLDWPISDVLKSLCGWHAGDAFPTETFYLAVVFSKYVSNMARRVNAKEALHMVLESDSDEDLDNDTYGNSDDFSDESDDESVADGINTHSMSNDDDSSGSDSHRAGAPQTQGQAQHSPPSKRYANTQMVSEVM